MYIKFLNSNVPLKCTVSVNGNIATLKFKDKIVVNTSGFRVYLDKECEYDIGGDTYEVFTTIYRDDETTLEYNGYQLSNDESVYKKPIPEITFSSQTGGFLDGEKTQCVDDYEKLIIPTVLTEENYEFAGWKPEIPAEGEIEENVSFVAKMQYVPTLEELKHKKKSEIATACENMIFAGVDVELNGEVEHFSLTTNDQINLFNKQAQIYSGVTQFEYHQDGSPCRYYSLDEMQKIIAAATKHISYHTTYCNSVNMWIAGTKEKEELENIFYGASIPEKYQSEVMQVFSIDN